MNSDQDKVPFSVTVLKALEIEVGTGKFLFTNSELSVLGIDTLMLEVEDGVAGRTTPTYLKKIYGNSLCDSDLGEMKIFPITRDKEAKREGIQKYIVFKCPDHIFNIIHEVRNLSVNVNYNRGTAWAYQHDSEMYQYNEKLAAEKAKKLILDADQLQKEHAGKLLALQTLLATSSKIKLEVMELIMQETAIQEE